MKIKKIEPTPSPNTMKVILDTELPSNQRNHYKKDTIQAAPAEIKALFEIDGVKMIYHVADFLAIERNPKFDWATILQGVRSVFGESDGEEQQQEEKTPFGEMKAFVQFFLGIPMQIKIEDGEGEHRFGLPARFKEAIFKLQQHGGNVVLERKWVDQGVRFGTPEEIGNEMVEEIDAAYSTERITQLLSQYMNPEDATKERVIYKEVTIEDFKVEDWRQRYELLDRMNPTKKDLPLLELALNDEKVSIRRLATAYLGIIGDEVVLPLLYKGMKDSSVSIRRTAGDVLSDLGFQEAVPVMIEALEDSSKLVRWRAAMFLYESGDESAIPALEKASDDKEFEVSLQAQMALERIRTGEEGKGSIWKQMIEVRKKDK
ncbi:MAG: conserved virulence factor C family protein [Bacillaceae bacterium]